MTLKKIGTAIIILLLSLGVVLGIVLMVLPSAQEMANEKKGEKEIPLTKRQFDNEEKALADVRILAENLTGDSNQKTIEEAESTITEIVDYLDAHWEKYDESDEVYFNMIYNSSFLAIITRGNDDPKDEINKRLLKSNIGKLGIPLHDHIADSEYIFKRVGENQKKMAEELEAERLPKIESALESIRQDKEGSVKEFVALLDARG